LLRRAGIALPVSVTSDGSPLGREASRMVGRSPRFDDGGGPLQVSIDGASNQPRACLLGTSHEQVACASVNLPADVSPVTAARLPAAELPRVACAVKPVPSQGALPSLDGPPASGRADRHVKSVLEQLGDGGR